MDYKAIFKALPHVDTIWVVGANFHLHPNNGGEKIERYQKEVAECATDENENEPTALDDVKAETPKRKNKKRNG